MKTGNISKNRDRDHLIYHDTIKTMLELKKEQTAYLTL